MKNNMRNNVEYVWQDRKRPIFGLPLSFTKYKLLKEKLLVQKGFFNTTEEETRLYRIMDVTLKRTFWQKIFGVGTIHCCSADKSTPEFEIESIKNPTQIKEILSNMIEEERNRKRIAGREFMGTDSEADMDIDDM